MNNFLRNGGLWVLAQNVLTLAVLVLGPMFRGQTWHWSCLALGVALFVVGAVFGVTGVRALGGNRTAYPKPLEDSKLVQHGVYALVRHPLYSSLMFASAGWSLAWSSGAALVASLALAILLDAKARLEEHWLREKFPDYAAYSQRVRRFVPWVF
ncbi:MAG: isoprenylcysteine carboxylmethyltransferase family protein [Verrucomicrobiales bacterium]|nr:isoprenylcysteine carboxylmethyltransferase family protein [Verrucomicrobiales bacterium]